MKIESSLYESITKIISEAPLPDDWDRDIYNDRVPFKKRIEYAKERAQRLGQGSSRVAFEVPYQGRPTVLKVAKNKKGMAQNVVEVELLTDGYLRHSGWVIPIIDYDTTNREPTWIHTEKAEKIRNYKKLAELVGMDPLIVIDKAKEISRGSSTKTRFDEKIDSLPEDTQNSLHDLLDLYVNLLGMGVATGDFVHAANWGVYEGKPVMIDIGLSTEVYDKHYRR